MVQIFKKQNKDRKFMPQNRPTPPASRQPVDERDLVDPVGYVGGLDLVKYPVLPQEKTVKEEVEVENPLNKRR